MLDNLPHRLLDTIQSIPINQSRTLTSPLPLVPSPRGDGSSYGGEQSLSMELLGLKAGGIRMVERIDRLTQGCGEGFAGFCMGLLFGF